jgi:hypothetical protein
MMGKIQAAVLRVKIIKNQKLPAMWVGHFDLSSQT